MTVRRILAVFIALLWITADAAHAAYTITDLGTLGGNDSFAGGINASGQVAGTSWTKNTFDRSFFYSNGVMHNLGVLPGTDISSAASINASGQVVGTSWVDVTWAGRRAFLSTTGGPMIDLGTLGGAQSEASSINDLGQIVGWSYVDANTQHGFLWQNGQMTDLGNFFPLNIDNLGRIVGSIPIVPGLIEHPGVYQNGVLTDLGVPPGTDSGAAWVSNSNGQIGVNAYTQGQSGYYAWVYQNGGFTSLGSLGGTETAVTGINELGQIVGAANLPGDQVRHPFLYQDGTLTDLQTLLPPGSGWELDRAGGINDAGQIVGEGFIGKGFHAFVMTPTDVPEPASATTLAMLAPIALLARRGRSDKVRRACDGSPERRCCCC